MLRRLPGLLGDFIVPGSPPGQPSTTPGQEQQELPLGVDGFGDWTPEWPDSLLKLLWPWL